MAFSVAKASSFQKLEMLFIPIMFAKHIYLDYMQAASLLDTGNHAITMILVEFINKKMF